MSGTAVDRKRIIKSADERRQDIVQAALGLFLEKGFGDTTVGDIASAAGVATGTVYLYFPSKDHILIALHDEFHQGMAAQIMEVATDMIERMESGEAIDHHEPIDTVLDAMARYSVEKRDFAEVCMRHLPATLAGSIADVEQRFVTLLKSVLEQSTSKGIFHASDPEMFAHLINGAMTWTFGGWAAFGHPEDLDRLVRAAKEFLYKALAPETQSAS
ncbi:MAG: TetR/AcrR family transcriptional regulator [Actinobacteria bacterium]|nr:TetR/AcrR family transcriptional regulator [Actinomycetota bacterium]